MGGLLLDIKDLDSKNENQTRKVQAYVFERFSPFPLLPDVKAILFLLSEGRNRLLECVDHDETPGQQKDQSNFEMQKLVLIWIVFVLLEIIFFKYMEWRVTRFLRGHCPNQRMSCIGKYKRNVINFKQTAYLMLIWQVNLLLDFPFQTILEKEETLSRESKFLIWVAKGIFFNEGFIFFFCIKRTLTYHF